MRQHLNSILADIRALPEVTDELKMEDNTMMSHYMQTYTKADRSEAYVSVIKGDPHYFKFLNIPMSGKVVDADASGTI